MCVECFEHIPKKKFSIHLRSNSHILNCLKKTKNKNVKYIKLNSAFKNRVSQHRFLSTKTIIDIKEYLQSMKNNIKEQILYSLNKFNTIKVGIELVTKYFNAQLALVNLENAYTNRNVILKAYILTKVDNFDKFYKKIIEDLENATTEGALQGSGWTIVK